MEYKKNIVYLNRPASIEKDMWKDALPIGNGITGALFFGAIAEETVIITRHDLWHSCGTPKPLSNISYCIIDMREHIDRGDFHGANDILYKKLDECGQNTGNAEPFPLGALSLNYICKNGSFFKHYRRGIDLEHAITFTEWKDKYGKHRRRAFVSSENGLLYIRIQCDSSIAYTLGFNTYKKEKSIFKNDKSSVDPKRGLIFFSAECDGASFGGALSVETTDGTISASGNDTLDIKARSFTIKLGTFAKEAPENAFSSLKKLLADSPDFESALSTHSVKFSAEFNRTQIELTSINDEIILKSNRELIDIAYDKVAPSALYEKLWKYARYLFLSGTAKGSNPFSLYGIWFGDYALCWSQNVLNENIELIYEHTLCGGLAERLREFIHYFYKMIPEAQELASKVYGCRGIYLPAYTHPETIDGKNTLELSPSVPVISGWISAAGWVSLYFYKYYKYTHDVELLNHEILPFMLEAARFYADYAVLDATGKVKLYPSVSPENTPGNLMPPQFKENFDHVCPISENATMDIAIMKSLIKNLLELLDAPECLMIVDRDELSALRKLREKFPDYMVNSDGAVKEWTSERLSDFYMHRHFSHLFPVFPGNEITLESDPKLFKAFRRAIELRPHGAQSGWSFSHVASIWARFGDGEKALENLDLLIKGCLLDNFFTLHNDWRHMGASVEMTLSPVQLDALMGLSGALQEMLLFYSDGNIRLLPSCPKRFRIVKASGLRIPEGSVSFSADSEKVDVEIILESACKVNVSCGKLTKSLKNTGTAPLKHKLIFER